MTYTLYHKNIKILDFSTEKNNIKDILKIHNYEHIPVGIFNKANSSDKNILNFEKWWKTRSIPASRQNIKEALEILGIISLESLVTKSFGLSLSDHYWAKPVDENITWEKINFFQNDFSEDVGKALFGNLNVNEQSQISLISPDNTSDGWLKKKWIIKNNQRLLVKSGSGLEQQEPFNEVLASEICKRLNINHVSYTVFEQDWAFYSLCPDFVNTEKEFVPANRIFNLTEYTGGLWDKYEHFKTNCTLAGISDYSKIEEDLCKMLILDFIIANTDRHFGNFGFLRNPDTLEWIGLAPVFDSGSSLFYKMPTTQLKDKNSISSQNIIARPFGYKQSDQIKLLPYKNNIKKIDFSKIYDIDEWFYKLLSQNQNISEERSALLCKILKERVKEAEETYAK